MKTATSKFVTTFDVFVVVAACACGAITGIVGLQNIKALNAKLKEVNTINQVSVDGININTQKTKIKLRWCNKFSSKSYIICVKWAINSCHHCNYLE